MKDKLPAVPASAWNEVNQNLALLDKQIAEASQRLITSKGQGGPNFVNNAILGPLTSKRTATIDRMAIAIGRSAPKPTNLGGLAECELSFDGAHAHSSTGPAGSGSASGSVASAAGNTATPTVNCPTVRDKLPGIPAQALAEVNSNLALLDKQIAAGERTPGHHAGPTRPELHQQRYPRPAEGQAGRHHQPDGHRYRPRRGQAERA